MRASCGACISVCLAVAYRHDANACRHLRSTVIRILKTCLKSSCGFSNVAVFITTPSRMRQGSVCAPPPPKLVCSNIRKESSSFVTSNITTSLSVCFPPYTSPRRLYPTLMFNKMTRYTNRFAVGCWLRPTKRSCTYLCKSAMHMMTCPQNHICKQHSCSIGFASLRSGGISSISILADFSDTCSVCSCHQNNQVYAENFT
jgi:hypothetical protein